MGQKRWSRLFPEESKPKRDCWLGAFQERFDLAGFPWQCRTGFWGRLVSALGAVGCAELQGSVSLKKKILLENVCEHKLLTENIFP